MARFVFKDRGMTSLGFCPMCRHPVTNDWPTPAAKEAWLKYKLCSACQEVIGDLAGGLDRVEVIVEGVHEGDQERHPDPLLGSSDS